MLKISLTKSNIDVNGFFSVLEFLFLAIWASVFHDVSHMIFVYAGNF